MPARLVVPLLIGALACADPVTPAPPQPPPPPMATLDGTWLFNYRVTSAVGPCTNTWMGRLYVPTIEISQAGNKLIAEGFMDLPQNEFTGTVNAAGLVQLTGWYPEDGFITMLVLNLTWDGEDGLAGTGTWEWTGRNGECERGGLSVTAVRI